MRKTSIRNIKEIKYQFFTKTRYLYKNTLYFMLSALIIQPKLGTKKAGKRNADFLNIYFKKKMKNKIIFVKKTAFGSSFLTLKI